MINERDYKDYFPTLALQYKVNQAFELVNQKDQYDVKANVEGGGITGQAEAVRLAIARALVKINEEHKPVLRANGLLTRDSRMVERKKPGQKKARKRFQFSKR
jgi:small subunit ribosomal protein S9